LSRSKVAVRRSFRAAEWIISFCRKVGSWSLARLIRKKFHLAGRSEWNFLGAPLAFRIPIGAASPLQPHAVEIRRIMRRTRRRSRIASAATRGGASLTASALWCLRHSDNGKGECCHEDNNYE
jgi:hypothetical protein